MSHAVVFATPTLADGWSFPHVVYPCVFYFLQIESELTLVAGGVKASLGVWTIDGGWNCGINLIGRGGVSLVLGQPKRGS